MYRIDDPSAAASLPAPEAAGSEGFWTEGNPATGVAATLERASWFNMMQEELRAIAIAGGQVPSKTQYNQVLSALQTLYGSGRVGHVFTINDWLPLPGGLILNWGRASTTGGAAIVTFPLSFSAVPVQCYASLWLTTGGAPSAIVGCETGSTTQLRIGANNPGNNTPAGDGTTINWWAIGPK